MNPAWGFSILWIFPLLCFAFMIAMMFMMSRRGGCMPSHTRQQSRAAETPRQILDRRYADGEITKEQRERMRRDIESQ